jgi:hypothetical protein
VALLSLFGQPREVLQETEGMQPEIRIRNDKGSDAELLEFFTPKLTGSKISDNSSNLYGGASSTPNLLGNSDLTRSLVVNNDPT